MNGSGWQPFSSIIEDARTCPFQPNHPPGPSGLKSPEAANIRSPLDVLQLFIPLSFVNFLVEQTNLYASQAY